MIELQSKEQFDELKQGNTVFLFTADWCPDCTFIHPFMPEVEQKFSQFTFVSVDRDKFIEICQEMDVFGIPSFIVFEHGLETKRYVNKDRKTQQQIEEFLDGSLA
ncbi:thioredoxin family protein [Chryseomicrobium sp. FSL W7-1435]|uniref:thioredoxin family protein n=1 Tax=Chryseomicrobium sp. FSL W7-1435 TaxID=2921704 RepID=UPI003159AD51